MQINNSINPILGAQVNHPIEVLESLGLEHPRVHVVLKVSVVDRQADAVQSERGEELGIRLREEVLEELRVSALQPSSLIGG
jgi:urease accessory protein UreE